MGRRPNTRRDPYGAWLHYLRTSKKLTQQELSDLTGVPQRTIAYWERSGKLAGRDVLFKLARALGVSVSHLLRVKATRVARSKETG
jgi:transcriptional regulator with XRE-family HTH domain